MDTAADAYAVAREAPRSRFAATLAAFPAPAAGVAMITGIFLAKTGCKAP